MFCSLSWLKQRFSYLGMHRRVAVSDEHVRIARNCIHVSNDVKQGEHNYAIILCRER